MEILEKHNRWCRISVPVVWSEYQNLRYVNEPFNDQDSLSLWKEKGYTQTKFTGDLYDMRSIEPTWIHELRDVFYWKHFSWSLYRMCPGCVLPNHSDTYKKFREIHDVKDMDSVYRAVIFMEPWQSGHYLEVAGTPVTGWQAGDGVIWQSDVEHLAANVGLTDRYTLQITGVPHENPFR